MLSTIWQLDVRPHQVAAHEGPQKTVCYIDVAESMKLLVLRTLDEDLQGQRSQLHPTGVLPLHTLQAAFLVGQGGAGLIPTVGLVVGFAVAAGMLAYNTQRALNLQYNDGDWVSMSCAGVQLDLGQG